MSRIFYFFFTKEKIVLTNGFIKKTQKTPKKEIEKAKEYKFDYIRRNEYEI
ncbi:MAG: type II toxin-antitoxin system RelE/ParE family toxin [Cetobacterium sp.]